MQEKYAIRKYQHGFIGGEFQGNFFTKKEAVKAKRELVPSLKTNEYLRIEESAFCNCHKH